MAVNLTEFFRESIGPYITKMKSTFYTKTESDTNISTAIDGVDATNVDLVGYTKPASASAVGATDSTQTAIGKIEKALESAGDTNVQSDWAVSDGASDAYIANKPDLTLKADLVTGKVPTSQLPDSVLGGLQYQGLWDASGVAPAASKGYYYIVSAAGATDLDGITEWEVGDWAVYGDSAWEKIDNTQATVAVSGDSIVAPFTVPTSTQAETDWSNA